MDFKNVEMKLLFSRQFVISVEFANESFQTVKKIKCIKCKHLFDISYYDFKTNAEEVCIYCIGKQICNPPQSCLVCEPNSFSKHICFDELIDKSYPRSIKSTKLEIFKCNLCSTEYTKSTKEIIASESIIFCACSPRKIYYETLLSRFFTNIYGISKTEIQYDKAPFSKRAFTYSLIINSKKINLVIDYDNYTHFNSDQHTSDTTRIRAELQILKDIFKMQIANENNFACMRISTALLDCPYYRWKTAIIDSLEDIDYNVCNNIYLGVGNQYDYHKSRFAKVLEKNADISKIM